MNAASQDKAHRVYSQFLHIVTMFQRTDTQMWAEACRDFTWLDSHIPLHHAEGELHPLGKKHSEMCAKSNTRVVHQQKKSH